MPDPGKFYQTSVLSDRPEFFGVVADRIWRAWWKDEGVPLSHIEERLRANRGAGPVPTALVAHSLPDERGDRTFLGTVSIIASDLEERPDLTPWVAALWVEEAHRRCGVGGLLIERAAKLAFTRCKRIYLCASRERASFYSRRGWTILEEDVGPHRLTVLARDAGS